MYLYFWTICIKCNFLFNCYFWHEMLKNVPQLLLLLHILNKRHTWILHAAIYIVYITDVKYYLLLENKAKFVQSMCLSSDTSLYVYTSLINDSYFLHWVLSDKSGRKDTSWGRAVISLQWVWRNLQKKPPYFMTLKQKTKHDNYLSFACRILKSYISDSTVWYCEWLNEHFRCRVTCFVR